MICVGPYEGTVPAVAAVIECTRTLLPVDASAVGFAASMQADGMRHVPVALVAHIGSRRRANLRQIIGGVSAQVKGPHPYRRRGRSASGTAVFLTAPSPHICHLVVPAAAHDAPCDFRPPFGSGASRSSSFWLTNGRRERCGGKVCGQPRHLFADVRDCSNLPECRSGGWSDREKPV